MIQSHARHTARSLKHLSSTSKVSNLELIWMVIIILNNGSDAMGQIGMQGICSTEILVGAKCCICFKTKQLTVPLCVMPLYSSHQKFWETSTQLPTSLRHDIPSPRTASQLFLYASPSPQQKQWSRFPVFVLCSYTYARHVIYARHVNYPL